MPKIMKSRFQDKKGAFKKKALPSVNWMFILTIHKEYRLSCKFCFIGYEDHL